MFLGGISCFPLKWWMYGSFPWSFSYFQCFDSVWFFLIPNYCIPLWALDFIILSLSTYCYKICCCWFWLSSQKWWINHSDILLYRPFWCLLFLADVKIVKILFFSLWITYLQTASCAWTFLVYSRLQISTIKTGTFFFSVLTQRQCWQLDQGESLSITFPTHPHHHFKTTSMFLHKFSSWNNLISFLF